MARALELETIAEGIEQGLEVDALQRLACDIGQAFLLGRPSTAEEIASTLLAGSSLAAMPPATASVPALPS